MTTAIETSGHGLTRELADLMEHEKAIEQGLAGVGRHLMLIRDDRKYKAAGYMSFEDYCKERWGITRRYADMQIGASQTMTAIEERSENNCSQLPQHESQVRPLVPIAREDPAEAADIWNEAVEHADGGQPTAAEVADLVDATEVAAILGLAHRQAVSTYRRRYDDFPEPAIVKSRCVLWRRADVEAWGAGRRARSDGRQSSSSPHRPGKRRETKGLG